MFYNVVVMGSINMDMFVHIPTFPQLGDNVVATHSDIQLGGKGANQAICIAKQNTPHAFIGAVGNDASGSQVVKMLDDLQVDTQHIIVKDNAQTGTCVALIDKKGNNTPIGILGANMVITEAEVAKSFQDVEAGAFLLQLETSKESILAALKIARSKGMYIILDPAPEGLFFEEALSYADLVTPNKNETERIVGFEITCLDDAVKAAKAIAKHGIPDVIVKLGRKGSVVYESETDKFTYIEAVPVTPVNTIGAGDTFAGVLATIMSEGNMTLVDAARVATLASSKKISRSGGPASIPTRDELGY